MANSLYQQLSGLQDQAGIVNQFNRFRNQLQGDPKQIVENLLQSGRMTQAQYNRLSQMATEFQKLLSKF